VVLTAAHCFAVKDIMVYVIVGDFRRPISEKTHMFILASKVKIYPWKNR